MRLRQTVVLYDGQPYYVHGITNHMDDGIFRIYCEPIGKEVGMSYNNAPEQNPFSLVPYDHPDCGKAMDIWINKYSEYGIVRKHMNSPAFNKFRPFPLGMCNYKGKVYYMERMPTRHTQQGLSANMLSSYLIRLHPEKCSISGPVIVSDMFKDMIVGDYPSKEEALAKLFDPTIANDSIAISRYGAIIRGPVGSVFFAYKNETVGILPNADFTCLRLDKKFAFLKETIETLGLFSNPVIV